MACRQLPEFEPRCDLVVTVDALNAGVHFRADIDAASLAIKAIAVNLSDLAAMGAEPVAISVVLQSPESWVHEAGLFGQAVMDQSRVYGFDVVRLHEVEGPLAVTIQAWGQLPAGQAILRSGARVGDAVYVTGTPGDAGMGLRLLCMRPPGLADSDVDYLLGRLDRPRPRLAIGRALRQLATSCIDISDGLAADLGHILEQSRVGASLEVEQLPVSPALLSCAESLEQAWELMLTAGDDYELCFTLPPAFVAQFERQMQALGISCTRIGRITVESGLQLLRQNGDEFRLQGSGYQHFSDG
jgi:thiamine-monophosphate kinase